MLWYHSFQSAREPMNSYTHFLGALLSLIGLPLSVLLYFAKGSGEPLRLLAALIFCCSTLALYTTSCVYHFSHGTPAHLNHLRKLDHSMIYLLIAGSYTPMLMSFYPRREALIFSLILWGIAAVGIVIKVFWFLPRWVSTAIYLLMGWSIIFDLGPLAQAPTGAIALLAAGGISYTIGGVIYGLKKPDLFRSFGFHELFHCFVLLGSVLHYLVVAIYIL